MVEIGNEINIKKFADVAQWLERLFCKQRVVGSNPSVGSMQG